VNRAVNLAVFRQSLRQATRTTAVLTGAAGLFYYLVLLSSSSFLGQAGRFGGFFANPPRAISAFLGGSADLLHPVGWLAAGMTHPITLALLSAAAFNISAGSVATEIERGTIDLVLSRPVGRVPFLGAKAAAALVMVTSVETGGLLGVLVSRATISRVGEVPLAATVKVFADSWMLFAAFAMLAVLVSARSSLRGHALGASVGIVVGTFFVNFAALLIDGLYGLRFASPFHYFRPADVMSGGAVLGDVLVLAAVLAVAVAAALWWFARRDLTR
jgi:ABC-2 type transport system permease protein